jgi:transcriptional regulator with XRE-family HTH domain
MSDSSQEKKRTQVTLNQVVAEKVGVSPNYVTKVVRGDRNSEQISSEVAKLNGLIDAFKSEPLA